jgi:methyl-accepting chemotaxis protein
VRDVSYAVTSVGQATQQSAKVVEQSASSAGHPQIQSNELALTIAQFQSGDDSQSVAV